MLKVSIVTPAGSAFDGEAEEVILPGSDGHFGVRTGHRPLSALLRKGSVRIKNNGQETSLAITGGFADISGTGVTILTKDAK